MKVIPVRASEIAKQINELDALAKSHANEAIDYARKAGDLLLQIKNSLPHGQFTPWLLENVSVSPRQAQRYMAVAEGKPMPVRKLASKNDMLSLLGVSKREDFIPCWMPTPGCWHAAVWDHAGFWVVPDLKGVGFHVSKLYTEDRSLPESQWQSMYDGTKGAVSAEYVDIYLKLFGLPCADKVDWNISEGEGFDRPFGEPQSAREFPVKSAA